MSAVLNAADQEKGMLQRLRVVGDGASSWYTLRILHSDSTVPSRSQHAAVLLSFSESTLFLSHNASKELCNSIPFCFMLIYKLLQTTCMMCSKDLQRKISLLLCMGSQI